MMIGARAAAWAKSGYTAKDYVQDGLFAMWDGIDNAGWGQHDPDATVWKDLVGGNDFILNANANVGDDCIKSVGGSYCGVAQPYSLSDINAIECLFVLNENESKTTAIFSSGASSSNHYNRMIGFMNNDRGLHFSNATNWGVPHLMSDIAVSVNFTETEIRKVDITSNTISFVPISTNGGTIDVSTARGYDAYIGGFLNSSIKCDIKSIRLYNRTLTAAEIAANYAIDKARFGLT